MLVVCLPIGLLFFFSFWKVISKFIRLKILNFFSENSDFQKRYQLKDRLLPCMPV